MAYLDSIYLALKIVFQALERGNGIFVSFVSFLAPIQQFLNNYDKPKVEAATIFLI